MKSYKLSSGQSLDERNINDHGDLEIQVQWANWLVPTTVIVDDDKPESTDAAVALFERVYAKREYWLMLAYNQLKIKRLEDEWDDYDEYVDGYRQPDSWDLPFSTQKYSLFNELLIETELNRVIFGTNGDLIFMFYNYSLDCAYTVFGTETEKFTEVKSSWDDMDA